jgi:hypothetical protein
MRENKCPAGPVPQTAGRLDAFPSRQRAKRPWWRISPNLGPLAFAAMCLLMGGCSTLGAGTAKAEPADTYRPMPPKISAEVDAFFAAFDSDIVHRKNVAALDRDVQSQAIDRIMAHYTPDAVAELIAYIPKVDRTVVSHYGYANIRSMYEGLREPDIRKEFSYRPGPTAASFYVRLHVYAINGPYATVPYTEQTYLFQRTADGIRVSSLSTKMLDHPIPEESRKASDNPALDQSFGTPALAKWERDQLAYKFHDTTTKAEILEMLGTPQHVFPLKHGEVLVYYLYRYNAGSASGNAITVEIMLTKDGRYDTMSWADSKLMTTHPVLLKETD